MTLDEAIKHEEEVAEEKENNAKNYPRPDKSVKGSGRKYNAYLKCAEEHRQLAEWLKDYKRLKEPCTDAISRQAVIKPFLVDATEEWTSADIVKYLKTLPPVTPAPRMGRWIPVGYDGYADGNPVYDWWECSECEWEHTGDEDTLTPYCPNCGAKMQEVGE